MRKVKIFPEKIELVLKNKTTETSGKFVLPLVRKVEEQKLSGLSQKICYENKETGTVYFVKTQKARKIMDIVGSDFSSETKRAFEENMNLAQKSGMILDEYTGRYTVSSQSDYLSDLALNQVLASSVLSEEDKNLFNKNKKLIDTAASHVKDVLIERTFLEALSPQIIKALMGDSVFVPENFLYLDEEGEAFILSQSIFKTEQELKDCKDEKYVKGFDEFLNDKSIIGKKTKPEDWKDQTPPTLSQFKLTLEQANILGQLYFVALLIGHWDLLNNIDLTNSGLVQFSDDSVFPAIVDHGNCLGTGFGGMTQAETFMRNPDKHYPFAEFKTETNFIQKITGFQFTDVYDDYVTQLQLPRSLVADLFDLTEKSNDFARTKIRTAQIEGFAKACGIAMGRAEGDKLLSTIPEAVNSLMKYYMSEKDAKLVLSAINCDMYHLSSKPGSRFTYNLANILSGRLNSLVDLPEEMLSQKIQEISKNRFAFLINSQYSPLGARNSEPSTQCTN